MNRICAVKNSIFLERIMGTSFFQSYSDPRGLGRLLSNHLKPVTGCLLGNQLSSIVPSIFGNEKIDCIHHIRQREWISEKRKKTIATHFFANLVSMKPV